MTRPGLVFLLFAAAAPLLAQSPQLAVTMSPSKTTVSSGERFDVTITARNDGSAAPASTGVVLEMDPGLAQPFSKMTAPAGWTCWEPSASTAVCVTDSFPPGAQAVLHASVHVLNTNAGNPFTLTASMGSGGPDDAPADNIATREIQVVRAPSTAALSIHAEPPLSAVPPGQTATLTVNVHNAGPDAATNVIVRAGYQLDVTAQMQGAGWTCSGNVCTRPFLAAGESAPIAFTFSNTAEQRFFFRFTVAAELSFDPNGNDDFSEAVISIGDAAAWRRILLPLAFGETPGAFGSLWKTETTAVLDAGGPTQFQPYFCVPRTEPCFSTPIGRPFDLSKLVARFQMRIPAGFVYVRGGDESKLSLNLRVRDLTRTAETWGTEVPLVRENEWRTDSIVLAPLPVDPRFRLTLRVYDYDAITGNRVAVRVYADDDAEPRVTLTKTFQIAEGTVTTALLPAVPGYIQIDPLAEAGDALAGAQTMWLRIDPLSPGLRFWAFASVTNNPTGHVTTVTPQ